MPAPRRLVPLAAVLVTAAALGPAPSLGAPSPPPVTVTAAAGPPAPLARIVAPRAGARVRGVVRPRLRILRAAGIRRLEMRIDGRLVAAWSPGVGRPPVWRTRTVPDGVHRIEIRTVGRSGVRRSGHRVMVANGVAKARTPGAAPSPAPASPGAGPAAAPPPAAPVPLPAPAPPPSAGNLEIPGTVVRVGNFNTGDLSQWSGYQKLRSYSLTTVSSPVREGTHAGRFEVRRGDDPLCAAGWGCYGDRSEVQMSTGEYEGHERWYSWSTMIGADFPRSSAWQVVSQWHANAEGSPPIGFYAENDDLVLRFHRHSGPGRLINIVNAWRGSLRRGAWQDIRLHVKWSASDSVGYVELWINGVPQVFDTGGTRRQIRTLYPGGYGNYFKQGLYRQAGMSQTGVVLHDGFRMTRPG